MLRRLGFCIKAKHLASEALKNGSSFKNIAAFAPNMKKNGADKYPPLMRKIYFIFFYMPQKQLQGRRELQPQLPVPAPPQENTPN